MPGIHHQSVLTFLIAATLLSACHINDNTRHKTQSIHSSPIVSDEKIAESDRPLIKPTESIPLEEKNSTTEQIINHNLADDSEMHEDHSIKSITRLATVISTESTVIPCSDVVKCASFTPVGSGSTPLTIEGFKTVPGGTIAEPSYASPIYEDYESPVGGSGSSSHAVSVDASLAGQLTAGEINDFQKWKMWEDISEDALSIYRKIWKISPEDRYTVVVQNESGNAIIDARAELMTKDGTVIWSSRTDNTGKAELWENFSLTSKTSNAHQIRITHRGKTSTIHKPVKHDQGVNLAELKIDCDVPDNIEILFTVDATGSMQDEISYLQAELIDVVGKIRSSHTELKLRLGSVFYRDHGDTYVTKSSDLSSETALTYQFISEQYADGGGDGPEAVDDALEASMQEISWSEEARSRIMFLILDAPPHSQESNIEKMMHWLRVASSKGVRLVPLVASGGGYDLDKSLEYLMRCGALSTNGTYAFLTDHSGIGGTHTAPTTDKYDVEKLNDLLVRIIKQFSYAPSCDIDQFVSTAEPEDTAMVTETILPNNLPLMTDSVGISDSVNVNNNQLLFVMKCYPNPASDYVMIQTSEIVDEMFLADNAGKIIQRIIPSDVITRIDLTGYPSGLYHMKAWINERWASVRIIIAHI
jgi:hypothetical protein